MLHVKHVPPAYIDRLLNSPSALRARVPMLKDRAKQDLAAGDSLAHQRTMLRLAETEREIFRLDALLDALLEKALQAEQPTG